MLVIYWPRLQAVFQTEPLGSADLFLLFLIGSSVLVCSEVIKVYLRKKARARYGVETRTNSRSLNI